MPEEHGRQTSHGESYHENRKEQSIERPTEPICDAGDGDVCDGELHQAKMIMNFLGGREEVSGKVCDYHIDRVHNRKRALENMGVDTVVFMNDQ